MKQTDRKVLSNEQARGSKATPHRAAAGSTGMTNWAAGYITDVNYIPGYFVEQSPIHMVLAARLVGIACDMPNDDDPVHYLELGCGLGIVALTLAASNPGWRITGIDFNPAHIANARALARQADVANATFIEADLASFSESRAADIPQADFVSLHGLWSWVSPAVQAGIVRLLSHKVRAGGIVHISYNALPGWQGRLGMQRLVRAAGLAHSGRSDRQVVAGFEILRTLHTAGARHLPAQLDTLLRGLTDLPGAYLAHEFMNACWAPVFHADVAAALSEAKLEWIGSGSLLENFPELTLTAKQREVHDRIDAPLYRELVKDLCLARSLRHDLFVRGAQRLGGVDHNNALHEIVVLPTVAADEFRYEIEINEGKVSLQREFYSAVMAELATGSRSIGQLLALPENTSQRDNPAALLGILVGTGQTIPVLRPEAPPAPTATALNCILARAFGSSAQRRTTLALAASRLGAGLPASTVDLFVHERVQRGENDSALDAWTTALGNELEPTAKEQLRQLLNRTFNRRLPIFRAAGVL
jgi:SAM-dependent methyltransferase